jgi:hypothetical protein
LDVQVAEEAFVPAGERKHRHSGGDADIDSHHSRFNAILEFASRFPGVGENRRPIPIGGPIGDLDCRVEVVHTHDIQHRPKTSSRAIVIPGQTRSTTVAPK